MFLDAEPERGFTRGRFDGGSVSVDDPDHVGDRLPRRRVRAISEDPVTEELAAEFQAALALHDVSGGGGMSATVMTADGTWSGTTGTADGVRDLQVDATSSRSRASPSRWSPLR